MDMQSIMSAISTVGFPIVCCAAMFYQNWKQDEKHEAEAKGFSDAINNNTLAIQKLITLIESRGADDGK